MMSNKRLKLSNEPEDLSKKINPDTWISASSIHNYMLNDPILDYIKVNYPVSQEESIFFNYITTCGKEFETAIMSYIKETLKIPVLQICNNREDALLYSKYLETVEAIKNKVPLIYQGVLRNDLEMLYGSPDLIVRSDYLNKIVKTNSETSNISNISYNILDIKFKQLNLTSDGIHLLNEGRMKANKGQLMIYERLLSLVLNNSNKNCYVLGRGYKYESKNIKYQSDNCFEKLGLIKYDEILNEKIDKGIEWLKFLKRNNYNISIKNTILNEMRPNMCNTNDSPYHAIKKKIAMEQEELTLLHNITYQNRLTLNEYGIYNIRDLKDHIDIATKVIKIHDTTLKMLKYDNETQKITNEFFHKNDGQIECYIDFETVSVFDPFTNLKNGPIIGHKTLIVMIGLVFNDNETTYYNFLAKSLTEQGEFDMFQEMFVVISNYCQNKQPKFYHWSQIERTLYSKWLLKNNLREEDYSLNFCDLHEHFKKEPVLVKNLYNFSLKSVANAFIENKLIKMPLWDSEECSNGLNASILLAKYYKNKNNSELLDKLIKYNKIDCMSMYHIMKYIRENMLE